MDKTIDLSVIIPVFNEEAVLLKAYSRITQVMEGCGGHYELLFVDDGSTDNSASILKGLSEKDDRVKVLIFSRNFGQQAALSAGIDCSSGRAAVLIDADLQDPPEVIPRMIGKWKEGYEVVYARRIERKGDSLLKRIEASLFYRLLNSLTDYTIPVDVGDFRLMDRAVCSAIKNLPERNRYLRGLVSWVGFKHASVEYTRDERHAGTSKYFFKKRLDLAVDALLSFSHKPLKLLLYSGCLFSVTGFILLTVALFKIVLLQEGFPLWWLVIASDLFFSGILLVALSMVSGYIARSYDETKGRPLYIIADKKGFVPDGSRGGKDGRK
jgi:dolichol-phosphate mannosyltransferase